MTKRSVQKRLKKTKSPRGKGRGKDRPSQDFNEPDLINESDLNQHGLAHSWEDLWPQERDIMIRPERYRYVRKLVKPKSCVFCVCAKNPETFDTLTIYKSKHSMVVLNKYPYNNGHILVLPRRHCGEIPLLSSEEYLDLMVVLKKAMAVLQKTYSCEGMNVGMNHGAVAGAGIPKHLHWHVIPRWAGDVNFFPLIAETKVVVESLESSYHRIREIWQEVEV